MGSLHGGAHRCLLWSCNNGDEKLSMAASYTEDEIDLGVLGTAKLTISTEADASRHEVIGELAQGFPACNDTPRVTSFILDDNLGFDLHERYAILCDAKYNSDRVNFQLPQNTPSITAYEPVTSMKRTPTIPTKGQILRPWTATTQTGATLRPSPSTMG